MSLAEKRFFYNIKSIHEVVIALSRKSDAARAALEVMKEREAQYAAMRDKLCGRMGIEGADVSDLRARLKSLQDEIDAEGEKVKSDAEALAQAQAALDG